MPVSIAIVDKPGVSADVFAQSVQSSAHYQVVLTATNSRDLFDQLRWKPLPDVALVDLNLSALDGFELLSNLNVLYPSIQVLALTASDDRAYTARAMQQGARGCLHRGCGATGLQRVLTKLMATGCCAAGEQGDAVTPRQPMSPASAFDLNNREYRFLTMACSELTYNEIADQMCVSPRTVDGCREMVFQKTSVQSRVGTVIKAIRHKLIER